MTADDSLIDRAVAYVKREEPSRAPASGQLLTVSDDDAPVVKKLGAGLLVAYLVDQGDHFTYVQGRDLHAAGIDGDELHRRAVQNLDELVDDELTLSEVGPFWMLTFDGNFEASLILLDELWDDALRAQHGGEPVVAIPARDVLMFCDARSAEGVAELRGVVSRVWPDGDHLITDRLLRRLEGKWIALDEFGSS